MIVTNSDLDDLIGKITEAGGNFVKDDYILVVPSKVIFIDVVSPVEIVKDDRLKDAVYLVQRKNYYRTEAENE